jgi:hypothetical protein
VDVQHVGVGEGATPARDHVRPQIVPRAKREIDDGNARFAQAVCERADVLPERDSHV